MFESLHHGVRVFGWVVPLLLLQPTPEGEDVRPEEPRSAIVAHDGFGRAELGAADAGYGWQDGWRVSQTEPARIVDRRLLRDPERVQLVDGRAIEIRGTNDRNNPLRRQLAEAITGDELFVRFLFQYDAASVDTAKEDEGEFVVVWFDDIDAGDGATHNANAPNVGVHVDPKGRNVFMARIGAPNTAFSDVELVGGKVYLVVARLSKSTPGPLAVFDTVELWVDPKPGDLDKPAARVRHDRSLNLVRWIGLSTGRKTEPGDRIRFDDLLLGRTWESVLGLPEKEPEPSEPMRVTKRVDFRRDVHPLLRKRCFECHAGDDPFAGTRLDVHDDVLGVATAAPGATSRLLEVVMADDAADDRMPPEGARLTAEEIDFLKRWVAEGIAWDDKLLPPPTPTSDHWAFQRIERPDVPAVSDDVELRTPIDAFVAARLAEQNLVPNGAASKRTLIRRLFLDLHGLPPSPEAVERFVADESPDAWERLVDRVLASPEYGRRWGRHWLDVARYAESNGHQHNSERPHAWRYRDYVVRAFNEDKPYDRFLREQIAGDELEPYADDHLVATGFLAAARYSGNELDKAIQRNDILVDVANTTSAAVLGLTLECAQCHAHKFDPITARDYYRFQGFFLKGQPVNVVLGESNDERARVVAERKALFDSVRERLARAERRKRPGEDIFIIPKNVVKGMTKEERARYDGLGRRIDGFPKAWSFYAPSTSPVSLDVPPLEIRSPLPWQPEVLDHLRPRLLLRGDVGSPGPMVDVGWPSVFGPVADAERVAAGPRTALVDWMVDRDNPLVARVWVNRIWQYHFGRGLVAEAGNFGVTGPSPSHPNLLDWLACELIESGWSTKHVHRLILASATYRRSSRTSGSRAAVDSDNRWLTRWRPRRLESEAIRDSLLQLSGELRQRQGGPSVSDGSPAAVSRRSIDLAQVRDRLPRMQNLFDGPAGLVSCPQRRVSTVALQPLFLLNNAFALERSRRFAARLPSAPEDFVEQAFARAFGRPPESDERDRCLDFLGEQPDPASRAGLAQAILNTSEFLYVP